MKVKFLLINLSFAMADLKDEGKAEESEAVAIALKLLCDSGLLNDKEKDYKIKE